MLFFRHQKKTENCLWLQKISFGVVATLATFQKSAGTRWRSWQSRRRRDRQRRGWPGSSCWCPSTSCRGTRWRSPTGWRRSPPGWSWGRRWSCKYTGEWFRAPPFLGFQFGWKSCGLVDSLKGGGGWGPSLHPPSSNITHCHYLTQVRHIGSERLRLRIYIYLEDKKFKVCLWVFSSLCLLNCSQINLDVQLIGFNWQIYWWQGRNN